MTQNNNLSVLPFYSDIIEQNHRKSYAYGNIYALFAHKSSFIPFQIIRPSRNNEITEVVIFNSKDEFVLNITTDIKEAGLSIYKGNGFDVIIYTALFSLSINVPIGQYYFRIKDGVSTWYSDIFTMVEDVSPFLKVEWYDLEDLFFDAGQIIYSTGYKNKVYLSTELGKPEYDFNEVGNDRDGYFFADKYLSSKKYKFNFLAAEFVCDFMRTVSLSDIINVTDTYGRQYKCDTFLITPRWETQGDIASVEAEFTTNTVIKKIGTGVQGTTIGGDFNNDFNNDFSK